MNARCKFSQKSVLFLLANFSLAGLALLVTASCLWADGTNGVDVFRVEEDWQLVVGDPDPSVNGPQVTCTISPFDMQTAYCAFDLNYQTQPDYLPGGLQVHTWDPLDPIAYSNSSDSSVMSTSGETVTWTQAMNWSAGSIGFVVRNGRSQTWGNFGSNGNGGQLSLAIRTTLPNLNKYTSQVSVDNSGVSFASNLVGTLTLVAVRWYDANGNLIKQNTTPRVAYPRS